MNNLNNLFISYTKNVLSITFNLSYSSVIYSINIPPTKVFKYITYSPIQSNVSIYVEDFIQELFIPRPFIIFPKQTFKDATHNN